MKKDLASAANADFAVVNYRTNTFSFSPTNMIRSNVVAGTNIHIQYGVQGQATVNVATASSGGSTQFVTTAHGSIYLSNSLQVVDGSVGLIGTNANSMRLYPLGEGWHVFPINPSVSGGSFTVGDADGVDNFAYAAFDWARASGIHFVLGNVDNGESILISMGSNGTRVDMVGTLHFDSSQDFTAGFTVGGTVSVTNSILPHADNAGSLGSNSKRFQRIHVGTGGLFSQFASLTNLPGEGRPYSEWRNTNGTGYLKLSQVDDVWKPTNWLKLSITNPLANQLLGFNSVTYSSGEASILVTNITDDWLLYPTNVWNNRQGGSAVLTNLANNPIPFTNILVGHTNIVLYTNSGVVQISNSVRTLTNLQDVARGFGSLTDGQVLKYRSAHGTWTNDTDSTGGGGGVNTNANQFGAAGATLTIKESALFTNTIFYSSDTNRTNISLNQTIGQAVPMFSIRASNSAPIVEFDNSGFLVLTNSLTNYNLGGTRVAPTNTVVLGVESVAGRNMPTWFSDKALRFNSQPFFGSSRIAMLLPSSGTTVGALGTAGTTLGGTTISHPDTMATVEIGRFYPYMTRCAAPASDKGVSGVFSTPNMIPFRRFDGNQKISGFFFAAEFMITNLEAQRFITTNITFCGLVATNSPNYTNVVIATNGMSSHLGLYIDARTQTNMYISSLDSVQFRTNTGINFVASNLYNFFLFQSPTSRFVHWKLADLTARTEAFGWFSNNVPTNAMKFGIATRNGTNRAHDVNYSKLYCEAPLTPQ